MIWNIQNKTTVYDRRGHGVGRLQGILLGLSFAKLVVGLRCGETATQLVNTRSIAR